MTAKHKQNAFHFQRAVVIAGVAGFAFQSMAVFLIALGALLLAAYADGDIRT